VAEKGPVRVSEAELKLELEILTTREENQDNEQAREFFLYIFKMTNKTHCVIDPLF
jgi:hypothetical protein